MAQANLTVDFPLIKQELLFEGKVYLLNRPRVWEHFSGGNLHGIYSYALVCPVCLEAWAKFHNLEDATWYQLVAQSCFACGDIHSTKVPGSLLTDEDPLLVDYLPLELVQREFELHYHSSKGVGKYEPAITTTGPGAERWLIPDSSYNRLSPSSTEGAP